MVQRLLKRATKLDLPILHKHYMNLSHSHVRFLKKSSVVPRHHLFSMVQKHVISGLRKVVMCDMSTHVSQINVYLKLRSECAYPNKQVDSCQPSRSDSKSSQQTEPKFEVNKEVNDLKGQTGASP